MNYDALLYTNKVKPPPELAILARKQPQAGGRGIIATYGGDIRDNGESEDNEITSSGATYPPLKQVFK